MPFVIVPIVEGHGEVRAVPVLFRRIIAELDVQVAIEVARPIRQPRETLLKDGGIEAAVRLAAKKIETAGVVFILLDSEGGCPKELGASILHRAVNARPDRKTSVVLPHQEFEPGFWLRHPV